VRKIDGGDGEVAYTERTREFHGRRAYIIPVSVGGIKRIAENPLQITERGRGAVNGHLFVLDLAKPPQIVEAEDVVGVGVGINDRIQSGDILAQALKPVIGRGVNLEGCVGCAEQRRGAKAFVPHILGATNPALAANNRYPMRRAGPQKCDFQIAHRFAL